MQELQTGKERGHFNNLFCFRNMKMEFLQIKYSSLSYTGCRYYRKILQMAVQAYSLDLCFSLRKAKRLFPLCFLMTNRGLDGDTGLAFLFISSY